MKLRSRFTRFVVAFAASLSLIAGVVAAPANAASVSSASVGVSAGVSSGVSAAAGIGAKKKVLTKEQKKAKTALNKAVKDLKLKEKNLKAAIKAQKKTGKAHAKAAKAAQSAQIRNVKKASKKVKARARAAAKTFRTAKARDDRALNLIARRTVMRDIAQAKVIRLDAKHAWLMNDISTLDCGVGTSVVTASGAVEVVRECGIVYMHEDGDTTHVKTTTNQLVEVRNIGLQTPERRKGSNPAQCGAEEAYQHFMGMMPEKITIVQLRSLTGGSNSWGGGSRPTRSVYKLNNTTGQFDIDVQAEQIKAGWSLWWPTAAEWAHNKTYLDLVNDAKARGVGIWNPNLCGPAVGNVPLMWFNANAPTIDSNTEPAFGEYVVLLNNTGAAMDLTGWSLRDNSLNFFWSSSRGWMHSLNKFGSMVLQPGEHRIIYLDNPDNYPLSASEYRYFNWGHSPGPQITNGSVSASFSPNYANGDGVYLQDTYGNIRASMTNPCTSSAMCETPAWVSEIFSRTRPGQIIPIPVALNKVRNSARDIYNPVVSIASGALAAATKTALTAAGFTAADGNTWNSPFAAGTTLAITDNGTFDGSNSVVGQRRAIADLTGRNRTTLYVHGASGLNTVPTLTGLSEADAKAAVAAAGFTVGTVTQTADGAVAAGVTSQVESGVLAVRTAISFTVNTPPVVP